MTLNKKIVISGSAAFIFFIFTHDYNSVFFYVLTLSIIAIIVHFIFQIWAEFVFWVAITKFQRRSSYFTVSPTVVTNKISGTSMALYLRSSNLHFVKISIHLYLSLRWQKHKQASNLNCWYILHRDLKTK